MQLDHNRQNITEKIVTVYQECDISTYPIDCFAILEHYGFRVLSYYDLKMKKQRLYEICKMFSDEAFRYKNTIAYNDNKPVSRIRFSLMHELGHYILKHEGEKQENEQEADCFASNILAPRVVIHKMGLRTSDQIHQFFGLSYEASNRALWDYRQWFFEKAQTTHQLSQAEEQLCKQITG